MATSSQPVGVGGPSLGQLLRRPRLLAVSVAFGVGGAAGSVVLGWAPEMAAEDPTSIRLAPVAALAAFAWLCLVSVTVEPLRRPRHLAAIVAFGVGGAAGSVVLGWLPGVAADDPALVAVGGLAAFAWLCLAAVTVVQWWGTGIVFREDAFAYRRPGLVETITGPLVIPYEDVDLVVRCDGDDETATFEVYGSGAPTVTLERVADPGTFSRVLRDRVPSPRERNRRLRASHSLDGDSRPIASERAFWQRWPRGEPLPATPVITSDAVPDGVRLDPVSGDETAPEWVTSPLLTGREF